MIRIADLFCGAGGESTGIIHALKDMGTRRYDLAAVNHWQIALATHRRNHPQARHFCASLQHLNPFEVFGARDRLDILWASPECTHHSNARGGRPCKDQSRASSWLVLKWLSELYVRRVIIENVPEFVNWGPLGSNGRPLKSRRGATFNAFISALEALGYKVEWRMLCAANYGDPTTRIRFFLQAVRGGGRIVWPEPTHAKESGLFGHRPWVPARDIIDWSIRGESIFQRRRPLAAATMHRIEAGIRRYWGEWAEPFLVIFRGTGRTRKLDKPLPTVTAGGKHYGLVEPFLVPFYGERKGQAPRTHRTGSPIPTIPASNKFGLVEPFLLQLTHGGRLRNIGKPLSTITTAHRGEFGIVQPFILHQVTWGRPRTVSEPLPTIMTRCSHGLVEPFLVKYYGTAKTAPTWIPLGSVTSKDRYGLVEGDIAALDITFRMLQPHELAAAQGFPRDYEFEGNRGEQVAQIGNAVPVNMAKALTLSALSA